MQFTRLRLSGFKSFVDPTELVIEPGLTGVVGPNGCGKSNLLEAIRWAMGENRAKSLRGSGMDDVIFAGSTKRPARNMAEVTLVLDNSNRTAPPPFTNEALLEVTRRIERDSGSAYRINGEDVRQKDVQLLFADAATGAHSPALVSQGRIGALINARPQDRRQVLEEAAGISGLHQRRREAESRLKSAENNLSRLQDVLQAMENQVGSLKRQARQAQRYKELSAELEQVEAGLLYRRWAEAADAVITRERTHREAQKLVASATERAAAAAKGQADLAAQLQPLRDAQVAAASALQRAKIERDNYAAELRRRAETLERLAQLLATLGQDQEREASLLQDAESALERLLVEEKRLGEGGDNSEALAAARDAVEVATTAAQQAERAYDTLSEQAAGARARKSSLESDLLALNRRLEQLASDKNRREAEIARFGGDDALLDQITGLREAISGLEADEQQQASAITKAEQATAMARQAAEDARAQASEMRGQFNTTVAELKSLQKLVASYATSGTRVMNDVSADAGYEAALGAALGGLSEAAFDAAALRSVRELGDLPAVALPAGSQPLSAVVRVPAAVARLISFTGLVATEDAGDALQDALAPGQQLVSVDGALWRWDGYVVQAGAPSRAAALLRDQNRLADLTSGHDALQARLADLEARAALGAEAVSAASATEKEARAKAQKAAQELAAKRRDLIKLEEEISRKQGRIAAARDALARLHEDYLAQKDRQEKVHAAISDLQDLTQLDQQLAGLRSDVTDKRQVLSDARTHFGGLEREAEAKAARLKAIARDRGDWQQRRTAALRQIDSLSARVQETEAEQHKLSEQQGAEDLQKHKLADLVDAAEAKLRAEQDKLAEAEGALRDVDAALKLANDNLAAMREDAIRAEAAMDASSERRKEIAVRIGERFECAPTNVLERVGLDSSDKLPNLAVLEAKLDKLRRERDRLGAVNLRAEEELADMQQQTGHLLGERKELEEAIQRLRGAINSLNREGRERLLAAFEVVNGHFRELFTTLFGGGEAYLELSESDDPLQAGLEIFASPPGKKLQNLSLLSGGEQALTALSLIFAVFITNPAPICVLDEVDAPLDDANVERFCNLLENMITRTKTRFLIVTHNAVTMARVNRLFGVTMAERGVSTLVSVDLERATALTEM